MRSIFITGAAAGIGRATAQLFAARGWRVGLYDVDEEGVADLARKLGQEHVHGALDVTDPAQFDAAVKQFGEHTVGRMDALFNNAGVLYFGDIDEVPLEQLHQTIDVNFKGVVHGVRACLPMLEHTARACGQARIVNMSSGSAIFGMPELAVYSASKFAVRSLTESLSLELAPKGIVVSDIMPSYVNTGMVHEQSRKARSLGVLGISHTPEEIAERAYAACHEPGLHHWGNRRTALLYRVAGLSPRLARRVVARLSGM